MNRYYRPRYLKGHGRRGRVFNHPRPGETVPTGVCECGCGEQTPLATITHRESRHFNGYPLPFIPGHGARTPRKLAAETFPGPTEAEIGYIAGMIDGEGSILVYQRWVTVTVANTDRPLMDWLAARGGRIAVRHKPGNGNHRRQVYSWDVSKKLDVLNLLQQVLPYLIVKRDKAEQAIAFLENLPKGQHSS